MAGITINESLSQLVSAGSDAMTNLYYTKFTGVVGDLKDVVTALTIRAGDFKAPAVTQGTHKVNFLTVDSDLPSAKIDYNTTFDLTFRVDQNYSLYKYLKAAQANTSLASMGIAETEVPEPGSPYGLGFEVYAPLKGAHTFSDVGDDGLPQGWSMIYRFGHLWVKKISPLSFSYNNSGEVKVTVTFGFFEYDYDPSGIRG